MRLMLAAIMLVAGISAAGAQSVSPSQADQLKESTGRTDLKSHQQHQEQTPQGPSGPLNTTSGGAPAESPQGDTPPGMQSAPEGSSKTVVDTKNK